MKFARLATLTAVPALMAALLSGCHSAYVEATVTNSTGGPVSLLEVDYPSASFGKETLPAGAAFHYRFKILGNGGTKVTWTDSMKKDHTQTGPELHEGEEGRLLIVLIDGKATWESHLGKAP